MTYDLAQVSQREIYHLLIGLVAPRPIALVTSISAQGRLNAAPFSAYNYLCTDPPIIGIGVGNRSTRPITGKDTAQNIRNTREFVVNVVNEELAQAMNICAIDFPPDVNELEVADLETAPSEKISVPRIASAPAALECREHSTIEIGNSRIILGEVISIFIRDEFINAEKTYVLTQELHAVGRMNGLGNYVKTQGAFFQIPRLCYEEWQARQNSQNSDEA